MQRRMKEFSMTEGAIHSLLERAQVGRISTIGEDGYPYTVAVHFIFLDGKIYFHGLSKGQKIDNIRRMPKVCFEVDEHIGFMLDKLEIPCNADSEYESAVVFGEAHLLEDRPRKRLIFSHIIKKYAPQYISMTIPEGMVKSTAIVEIQPERITGKYHN